MIISIPRNLVGNKLMENMYRMMSSYILSYGSSTDDIIDDSFQDKSFDYILDLIKVLLPDNDDATNRYIATLFYECKGTKMIFQLMEDHLGIVYKNEPIYNIDLLELDIDEISGNDLKSVYPALINFLNALLYFNDLNIIINIYKLYLSSEVSNKSSNSCIYYKKSYFEFK